MPILDFEAYKLSYYVESEGHYDEEDGHYEAAEGRWVCCGRCNAVPAGRNNLIGLPDGDGRQVMFSYTIILHNPASREFMYGEKIRLTTIRGMETKELTVKGFARYQHQCKIYA